MNTSDVISDMLTRLRNAMTAGHEKTRMPASRHEEDILKVLAAEGFVANFKSIEEGGHREIQVRLKYDRDGEPVIGGVQRISKPGRRVYRRAGEIPPVLGGMGISVVSTSRGVMSDRAAREQKLGGEVLFNIW